jgi:hypothetical protein
MMKKTFTLKGQNKNAERQADAIKHEIKKYLTRERNKETPENIDFWDFNCKIGISEKSAKKIDTLDINKNISSLVAEDVESFYLEILAKPGFKVSKQ